MAEANKETLQTEVEKLLKQVLDLISSHKWNQENPDHQELWKEMVDKAGQLHKLVKPKHHKYMLVNRGVSPDDPEFYNHIHPIQDLLAFMKDPHANDDPEDQTIDHEFSFRVYSRRWGHDDKYEVKRTSEGWEIRYFVIGGLCNKKGQPFLFENLDHDGINYPEELPGYMQWLWDQAKEQGLSHEQVQEALDQLSNWVSLCEKNTPKDVWEGFK
jgi:hypothetical protein